ncbi:hypothetical protein KDK88_04530 [bacterium]|nr:hypothetical protein [bacterium]HPF35789.1 hypothetical protein [Candidatus Krumholzibacteria bacterium]HRX51542.1 hypothetical protein [Candidatus Krumholzibacteria bacterium]
MAKTTTAGPTSFYELILTGPEDLVHGYLTGLMIGAGVDGLLIHGPEEEIEGPGFGEKLKQALRVHVHENQVIVDGETRGLVKKFAKRMFAETGLELTSDRKVRKARFEFRFKAYAPRYGQEIKALLKSVPKGVTLSSLDIKENVDPSAKGVEAYAATHDYEIKGSGTAHGRFDTVLETRRIMDTHPLIEVTDLVLDLA